jgi:hypothetical protein
MDGVECTCAKFDSILMALNDTPLLANDRVGLMLAHLSHVMYVVLTHYSGSSVRIFGTGGLISGIPATNISSWPRKQEQIRLVSVL